MADTITLSLDHVQRLNLVMLLGNLEANVGEMRALWKLQDILDLSREEKETIGFFAKSLNGSEVQGWDVTKNLPLKAYDLTDGDVARIARALQQYPRHRVNISRAWMEPLFAQIPNLADGGVNPNGGR
jgi:hypothetical protein